MPNANIGKAKKSVEKKRHLRIVNVLKESVRAIAITKRILSLEVSLTVGELLASAPAVKKQFTKTNSDDEVMQFCFNTLSSAKFLEDSSSYFWYFIRSPKAKVRLENGSKVMALLDTGVVINVMTRKLMEDINLAMR